MANNNLFKTIASAFVEIQDENGSAQNKPQTEQFRVSEPVQTEVKPSENVTARLDNALFEKLCTVVEESNIPGPDYVELMKAAQNDTMKKAIPDEKSRFTAAYISIKATNPELTKERVLGSIDEYVRMLEEERNNGLSELHEKWVNEVDEPEKRIASAQEEITKLQQQLQDKIRYVSEERTRIDAAKNENTSKKMNFNYTFDVFINKLKEDKVKLNEVITD